MRAGSFYWTDYLFIFYTHPKAVDKYGPWINWVVDKIISVISASTIEDTLSKEARFIWLISISAFVCLIFKNY